MSQELLAVLNQLERERGVAKEILHDALKTAIASAARKQYSLGENVEVDFDLETGEIRAMMVREVVRIIQNPEVEIDVEEAMEQVHPLPAEAVEVTMAVPMEDKIKVEAVVLDIQEE